MCKHHTSDSPDARSQTDQPFEQDSKPRIGN